MKVTFVKCDYCNIDMIDETGKCVFALHKRIVDGKEYFFCCEKHADRFVKEEEKKKKK